MSTKVGGGARKIGRNLAKCKQYTDMHKREKAVAKRHIKWLKNRERWAADADYQKHQEARRVKLSK